MLFWTWLLFFLLSITGILKSIYKGYGLFSTTTGLGIGYGLILFVMIWIFNRIYEEEGDTNCG
jgi:uncharacterized membrane protein